jgi:hypothetical protein
MSQVISASRRTDIPAFYSDWLVRRLRAGFVQVRKPYSNRYSAVSLKPEDVTAVVFWSKNYEPLLSKLEKVEQTTRNLFFHFTITANQELEPGVPNYKDAIRDYLFLVRRYSAGHVVWRYDPLCITEKISYEVHEERFTLCAEKLRAVASRCIISFVHPYKKVFANMRKYGDNRLVELSQEKKREYAVRLATRAKYYGIGLSACCNDYLLSDLVQKASCIDAHYLSELYQTQLDTRSASTREECVCTKSVDIGAYDTCAHGCVYCYANSDQVRARFALLRHEPTWNALGEHVPEVNDEPEEAQQSFLL